MLRRQFIAASAVLAATGARNLTSYRTALPGMVLGPMLEKNFVTSMIKAAGELLSFF